MLTALMSLLVTAAPGATQAKPVSIPTSTRSWNEMTDASRSRYARITVQALRRSPAFARCEALDADLLEIKITEAATDGAPLIMAVAAAAYAICDGDPAH